MGVERLQNAMQMRSGTLLLGLKPRSASYRIVM